MAKPILVTGAAGFVAAGVTVAIIERQKFGGTCVNTGCIPTKTLVASAYAAHVARRGVEYGFTVKSLSRSLPSNSLARSFLGEFIGETFMKPANPSHHVYELRLYSVNEGKLDALIARFGNHTDAIFKRHNMKSVGYWRPEDAPYSENMFVYILEHPSREEARKNWAAFQADPEWKKVKADSETNGALANHIDSYFMDPTSFSALK